MRNKRFFSLRSKALIFSVVLTVLPLLTVSGFSYFESTKVVRSQVIGLNLVNAKQISGNLDFMMNDINTVSLNLIQNRDISGYLSSGSPEYQQRNHSAVLRTLNDQMFNKPYMYSVYIQDQNGVGVDNRGAINTIEPDRLRRADALKGKESWYFDRIVVQNKQMNVMSMIREIRDVNHVSRSLGFLKINVLESSIRDLYRSKLQVKSLFYLIGQDEVILSSLSSAEVGTRMQQFLIKPDMESRREGYFNATIGGSKYLAVYYRMETRNWHIVELTPYEFIAKPGDVIKRVTFISMAASLAVCLAFIFLFGARILKPLKQIRSLMKNVERENFDLEMKVHGNDEITLLARSFNRMSHKLNELINEVHVSKLKQKDAELKALEEQINPHFLYNTLDLIYWMSRMEKAFESSAMINALSQLFRIGLNSGSRFTTVEKEVEHIQHYILIQQKRYEETITFTIDVEPDMVQCRVTKMVLQPIVENAIHHGIEQKGGFGRISIRIYQDELDVVYTVWDDGAGADEAAIRGMIAQTADERQSLGLKNINDRLKLNYGNAYGVEFRSEPGKGTTVSVRQPLMKGGMPNV